MKGVERVVCVAALWRAWIRRIHLCDECSWETVCRGGVEWISVEGVVVTDIAEVTEMAEMAEMSEVAKMAEMSEVAEMAEVTNIAEVTEMSEVAV
jgi:hypothetical protein